MIPHITGPGGSIFQKVEITAMNRGGSTALVVGDVMALDLTNGDADTQAGNGLRSGLGRGISDSYGTDAESIIAAMFENAVQTAAGNVDGVHGVVTDLLGGSGLDNTPVKLCLWGIVRCYVKENSVARGSRLMNNTTYTTTQGRSLIAHAFNASIDFVPRAIALETTTASAGTTRELTRVLFNGFSGLSGINAAQ